MIWSKPIILWMAGAVLITNVVTNVVTYVTVEQNACPPVAAALPAPPSGVGGTIVGNEERY